MEIKDNQTLSLFFCYRVSSIGILQINKVGTEITVLLLASFWS